VQDVQVEVQAIVVQIRPLDSKTPARRMMSIIDSITVSALTASRTGLEQDKNCRYQADKPHQSE